MPNGVKIWAAAAVLCAAMWGGCSMYRSEPGDAAGKRMVRARKDAAHRARRIIFDNDGNEPVYYCDEATPECLLAQRTTPLIGSQVDTIVYCTWSSGFSIFTHNTKIGEVFTCTAEEPGGKRGFSKNKTQAFLDQGTDPLEIVVDFCREHDIEVFWSMRMNDIHDGWGAWYSPHLFPKLKEEHPEYLMGTAENRPVNGSWTAVDYGCPEIRDLAFRFIEEVCRNYDVDGVQLDFFRHLTYFRAHAMGQPVGQEELDMMTDLIRRVRDMADEVAVEKGHPILISVRVPDSVELCRAVGFDIERWMQEDLIDILTVSGYFRLNPWETTVALAHHYDVPVWPCLSETRERDAEAKKARASLECYRARAMNAWNAGADGIYMFNYFNPTSPLWWELGDPKTLEPLDKTYLTAARGFGNVDFWYEGGERFMNRCILSPSRTRKLEPGRAEVIELNVGERLGGQHGVKATLRLRIAGLDSAEGLSVALNGTELEPGPKSEAWIEYEVAPGCVTQGINRIQVTLAAGGPAGAVLEDLLLDVRHPKP
ncbi:MAG: family 10 glycosylhydrolase [Candidatus Hydrogenedentes bacterium]|nr:family 10 glycosylhydrolase [Candidatus Hydrogenedentota bacterium]